MNKIKLFPLILINVGILMVLNNISINIWDTYWPTILITIGIGNIINSFNEN